ncbi:MAG: NUDIX domain-containing protein, partial [Candidatus Micrarchaeota archaeon]
MEQVYPHVTVGALIFNARGEVLLARSPKWANKWTIPGGHIELGERAEEALAREVKEEVGLEVEVGEFLMMQQAIYSKEYYKPRHFIFLDYVCKAKSENVKVDGREMKEWKWVEPKEALKLE